MISDKTTQETIQDLCTTIRFFSARGWTPATSSNFSIRTSPESIAVSRSGVDKSQFKPTDMMLVTPTGTPIEPIDARPSAETLIHCVLYESPAVQAVLHTHSVNATVCSQLFADQKKIQLQGYEILKGLEGIESHETMETLPIFPNSQDMRKFSNDFREYHQKTPGLHGFLIEGHGLYTWGGSLFAAKRHIEVFEFLFECILKKR